LIGNPGKKMGQTNSILLENRAGGRIKMKHPVFVEALTAEPFHNHDRFPPLLFALAQRVDFQARYDMNSK
jgi:hypothetical protein